MTKGQRKSGLTLPPSAAQECRHQEVFARIPPQMNQYHCEGCGQKLLGVILQFALMTPEEFEQFKKDTADARAAMERKKLGIVLPGEVQQEGQKR